MLELLTKKLFIFMRVFIIYKSSRSQNWKPRLMAQGKWQSYFWDLYSLITARYICIIFTEILVIHNITTKQI